MNQHDLINIDKSHNPTIAKYKFFSNACGTLLRKTIFWAIQQSLNKLRSIEIMQRKVLLPLRIKLEINDGKILKNLQILGN